MQRFLRRLGACLSAVFAIAILASPGAVQAQTFSVGERVMVGTTGATMVVPKISVALFVSLTTRLLSSEEYDAKRPVWSADGP